MAEAAMTKNVSFHFFTLLTNDSQYNGMKESLHAVGFDESNSVFTTFDNRKANIYEPYSAIGQAVREAQAPYVIFCHQDLLFHQGPDELRSALEELSALDPTWAVAGNAGRAPNHEPIFFIQDHTGVQDFGTRPGKVLTLDENFLVIRRDSGLSCSTGLSGFHLYATDLCLNAYLKGLTAYVIEFRLTHLGSSLDYNGLYVQAIKFVNFWRFRVGGAVLQTPSAMLVLSPVPFLYEALVRRGKMREWQGNAHVSRKIDRLIGMLRVKWLPRL